MDVEKRQTCPPPRQCPRPFILKSEKPAAVTSAAPEPVVPETQVLPVMKVPMQYGTIGPSTVPATQISALISKDTT